MRPQRRFPGLLSRKTQKMTKIFKKIEKKWQKLVPFCAFVFLVLKYVAHKMVKTSILSRKRSSSTLKKLQPKISKKEPNTSHKEPKKITKKQEKLHHFEPKNSLK